MTEQEFRKNLAQNLARYRKLNGMTQQELAESIGYSNKSISKWECGDGEPDPYTLYVISEIYDVNVSELIGQTSRSKETSDKLKTMEKDIKAKAKARKKALERAKKHARKRLEESKREIEKLEFEKVELLSELVK